MSIKLKNFIKQLVKIKLPKNDVLPADCIIVTGEMENMIHWGIKMTMYLLQRSDKKLICPFYFSDRAWISIFLLCLHHGRVAMCTLQPPGWRDSRGHSASYRISARRNNNEVALSVELNTCKSCRNINNKQTLLAKINRHLNAHPEIGLFGWVKSSLSQAHFLSFLKSNPTFACPRCFPP